MNKIALLKMANIAEQVAAMQPEYVQAATNPWETAFSSIPTGVSGALGAGGLGFLAHRLGAKTPGMLGAAGLLGAALGSGLHGYTKDYVTRESEAKGNINRDLVDIQSDLESAAQFSSDPQTQFEMMQAAQEINDYLGK